jgi:putative transposase
VDWQRRCAAHFERSALAHVPASATGEAAEDLKAASKARKEKTARTLLAEEFVELYGERHPKAISIFEAGIGSASTYLLNCPGAHHARMRTTNALERLFQGVKRRTKVVGVFPNETSALATEIALRSSEEWALKRCLDMEALEAVEKPNPQHSRR